MGGGWRFRLGGIGALVERVAWDCRHNNKERQ